MTIAGVVQKVKNFGIENGGFRRIFGRFSAGLKSTVDEPVGYRSRGGSTSGCGHEPNARYVTRRGWSSRYFLKASVATSWALGGISTLFTYNAAIAIPSENLASRKA